MKERLVGLNSAASEELNTLSNMRDCPCCAAETCCAAAACGTQYSVLSSSILNVKVQKLARLVLAAKFEHES